MKWKKDFDLKKYNQIYFSYEQGFCIIEKTVKEGI